MISHPIACWPPNDCAANYQCGQFLPCSLWLWQENVFLVGSMDASNWHTQEEKNCNSRREEDRKGNERLHKSAATMKQIAVSTLD